jgi:hypothetical protein
VAAGRRGREQPALPRSTGLGRCPGDKMIDWVSPPAGDAAAQSNQAARLAPLAAGLAAADSGSREPAAVVPIGCVAAGVPAWARRAAVRGQSDQPSGIRGVTHCLWLSPGEAVCLE